MLADKKPWIVGMVLFLALVFVPTGRGLAAQLWLDELRDSVTAYRASYPEGDWEPYLDKLTLIQEGIDHADQRVINTAMDDFLMMLRVQAHGINEMAAHALYWIALALQPREPSFATRVTPLARPG